MNKQQLIKKIAADAEVTQRQASVMLESTLNAIIETVAAGEKIQLALARSNPNTELPVRVESPPHRKKLKFRKLPFPYSKPV